MSDVDVTAVAERVMQIEFRRPPHNFFDEALLTEVADQLLVLDEDPRASVVVLCSEGRHFCAGVDLRAVDAGGIRRVYRQAFRIFSGRKPIVAAVQGRAVGGGLGLAMAADFRVAAPDARFTANFAKLGFHPGFGLSVTLPAAIGQQRALDLLYTGRAVDGATAVTLGLADALDDDPRAAAVALAARLAESAPLSLVAIRATMRRELRARISAALDIEADAQAALLPTDDFREGIAATIAKRVPAFRGS